MEVAANQYSTTRCEIVEIVVDSHLHALGYIRPSFLSVCKTRLQNNSLVSPNSFYLNKAQTFIKTTGIERRRGTVCDRDKKQWRG